MTRVELSFFRSGSPKGFHKLSTAVELEHVVRSITVGNENRAVWPDCYRAWLESVRIFVDVVRLFRKPDGPLALAIELELDHLVIGWPRRVDIFPAAFITQFQSMNAGRPHQAEELSLMGKD